VKLLGPGEYAMLVPGQTSAGHFGLAVLDYTHSTAPNRRYADVIIQRLVKCAIQRNSCPYTREQLSDLAARCTERDKFAKKVERFMRKAEAAVLLSGRLNETFDAIVTGASAKGYYARIIAPPAEGRIMRGGDGLRVGQKIRIRLVHMDPYKGFIDFERVHS
jgi:exoribonuclease-2